VWILAAGSLINRFGSFVLPFLVLYLRDRQYSAAETGAALALYGAGKIAAGPSGGYLSDRLGPKATTVLSMFAGATAMLALWLSAELLGPREVDFAAFSAGWASELYRPAVTALIAGSAAAGPAQVTAFAVYQLATNVGLALGPAVGGIVARHSFAPLFIGDAATSLAWGALALAALPRDATAHSATRPSGTRAAPVILRDGAFLRFWTAGLLTNVVLFQAQVTLPLWMTAHRYPSSAYGVLLALSAVLTACFQLPLTAVTTRFPAWIVVAIGSLLAGAGFGMLALGASWPVLILSVLIWSGCDLVAWPVAGAWVAAHAPAGLTGRYAGARSLTFGLGLALAPVVGTTLYTMEPRVLWLSCLALGATSALLLLVPGTSVRVGRAGDAGPGLGQGEPVEVTDAPADEIIDLLRPCFQALTQPPQPSPTQHDPAAH